MLAAGSLAIAAWLEQQCTSSGTDSQSSACSVDTASSDMHGLTSAFALQHRRPSKRSTVFSDHTCNVALACLSRIHRAVGGQAASRDGLTSNQLLSALRMVTIRSSYQRHGVVAGWPLGTIWSDAKGRHCSDVSQHIVLIYDQRPVCDFLHAAHIAVRRVSLL